MKILNILKLFRLLRKLIKHDENLINKRNEILAEKNKKIVQKAIAYLKILKSNEKYSI